MTKRNTTRLALRSIAVTATAAACLIGVPRSGATFRGANGLLVYQAQTGRHIQLFTIRADGTGRRQITHMRDSDALNPEWSPDGQEIVSPATTGPERGTSTRHRHDRRRRQRLPRHGTARPERRPDLDARRAYPLAPPRWLRRQPRRGEWVPDRSRSRRQLDSDLVARRPRDRVPAPVERAQGGDLRRQREWRARPASRRTGGRRRGQDRLVARRLPHRLFRSSVRAAGTALVERVHDPPGWKRPAAAHASTRRNGQLRRRLLVARRKQHRLRQQPRWRVPDLRDERRRHAHHRRHPHTAGGHLAAWGTHP